MKQADISEGNQDSYAVVIMHKDGVVGYPVTPDIENSYPSAEKAESSAKKLLRNNGYSWNGVTIEVRKIERNGRKVK